MRGTARAARSVNYQVGLFLSLSLSQTLLERFSACLRMRIMSPHEVTISACRRMSPHELDSRSNLDSVASQQQAPQKRPQLALSA